MITGRPSTLARPKTKLEGVNPTSSPRVVVVGHPRDRANLVETVVVDEGVDPFADGEAATVVLALDFIGAAELKRQRLAPAQLLQFRFPTHDGPFARCRATRLRAIIVRRSLG